MRPFCSLLGMNIVIPENCYRTAYNANFWEKCSVKTGMQLETRKNHSQTFIGKNYVECPVPPFENCH